MTRVISPAALLCALLLTGCGSMSLSNINIWPFGNEYTGKEPGPPPNSVEYRCNGGKSFYLRMLPDGNAWVIYPDRQVRLDKTGPGDGRYSNGIATLQLGTPEATLEDGNAISYSGCAVGAKPAN